MKRIISILIILVIFSGCSETGKVKKTKPLLGTMVEITVADKSKSAVVINRAISKAFLEMERVERLLSRFIPESDISRINANSYCVPTKVSQETLDIIEKSIYFSQLTNGAFDISVYPLLEVWGFKQHRRKYLPRDEEIKAALQKVGYQKITILKKEQSIFLEQGNMSLDLGGIAKGYAVNRAINVIKEEGISNALVNAGGDIYALGRPAPGKKWRIAVKHPRKKYAYLAILELEDQAVATSGDYQSYLLIEGKRYSHIIDPQSGRPCLDVPASVTVIARDCLSADALSTSIFVLGPEKGIELIDKISNIEAIVASYRQENGEILLTQGLQDKIKVYP